jgi:hypothetical protein
MKLLEVYRRFLQATSDVVITNDVVVKTSDGARYTTVYSRSLHVNS